MKIVRESQKENNVSNVEIGDIIHTISLVGEGEKFYLISPSSKSICFVPIGADSRELIIMVNVNSAGMLESFVHEFTATIRSEVLKVIKAKDCELFIKGY